MSGIVGRAGAPRRDALPLEVLPVMRRVGDTYLICPRCKAFRWHLYLDEDGWGCRECINSDYASRHEVYDPCRVVSLLRRKLGANPKLGTRLPQPQGPRERRLVRDIHVAEERALVHARAYAKNYEALKEKP